MNIPTSKGSTPKAFGLSSSRDLLDKLYWEIAQAKSTRRTDLMQMGYHLFNGAVTAWHITD